MREARAPRAAKHDPRYWRRARRDFDAFAIFAIIAAAAISMPLFALFFTDRRHADYCLMPPSPPPFPHFRRVRHCHAASARRATRGAPRCAACFLPLFAVYVARRALMPRALCWRRRCR